MVYNPISLDRNLVKTLKTGFCKGLVAFSLISLLSFSSIVYTLPRNAVAQSDTEDFKTYTNTGFGIVIQYPADWSVKEGESGDVVHFYAPLEDASDQFSENVGIRVSNVPAGTSLTDFTDAFVKELEKIVTDFKIIESTDTTFAANPAHMLVYTTTQGQYKLELLQIYTIKDDKFYLLTYGAEVANYSTYLPAVMKMIDSFKTPRQVSGKYINVEVGLQMSFPQGWSGLETKQDNTTSIVIVPTDGRKLSMVMLIGDISEVGGQAEGDPLAGCNMISVDFVQLNGMSTLQFVVDCDKPEGFMKIKAYILATNEKAIAVMFVAPSKTAYDSGIAEFEDSVKSLSIKDTVNVFNAFTYYGSKTPQEISDKYANSEAGISIELPEGWRGFEKVEDDATIVTLVPPLDEKGASVIAIGLQDISSYKEEECKASSIEYVKLNGMSTLQAEAECPIEMMKMKSKGYVFATSDKIFAISYAAPTEQDYNLNLSKFEQTIKTLNIKNTVDVTAYVPLSIDFKSSKEQVTVDDKPYEIEVASSSDVTDIEFNQEDRQLSFAVQGESGTKGTSS